MKTASKIIIIITIVAFSCVAVFADIAPLPLPGETPPPILPPADDAEIVEIAETATETAISTDTDTQTASSLGNLGNAIIASIIIIVCVLLSYRMIKKGQVPR